MNPRYLKAIKRRAHAYTKIQRHKEALIGKCNFYLGFVLDMQVVQILENAPLKEPAEDIEYSAQLLANKRKDEFIKVGNFGFYRKNKILED